MSNNVCKHILKIFVMNVKQQQQKRVKSLMSLYSIQIHAKYFFFFFLLLSTISPESR